jgi:hypothetical protein
VCGLICLEKDDTLSSQRISGNLKNCIVFLVPGIKRFSWSEHTKDTQCFDSMCNVLQKVATDPTLLDLEANGARPWFSFWGTWWYHRYGTIPRIPLDGYLEPKFPIVKSSLVQGEEPWNLFEMRNLPALLCVLQVCGSHTFPCYVSFIAVLINCFTSYSL